MELYPSHPDEHLFSLLKNDDERAFTELYERYWKKLLVRANILLNSREDAEELVHDIFVSLWNKRDTLVILHSFHTYIAAMLQYGCFKILAKRRHLRIKKTAGADPDPVDFSTQQWLDFNDLRNEMEMAVNRLPDKCRLIFRLSREEHLSDKEIARRLDLSVNTVRTQMHRALQRLRASLSTFFCL
jgi:RNA polymerase sigma-70 factor (ECF subfamily)